MKPALNPNTIQSAEFEVQMDVCVESGYEGFELMGDDIDRYLESGHDLNEIKTRLFEKRVAVAAIYGGNPFWPLKEERAESLTAGRFERYCKYCAQLGCEIISINTMENVSTDVAVDQIAKVCSLAQARGIRLAYEPLGFAPRFRDIQGTLELLEQVERDNFGILLDPFHLHRGGSSLRDIELIPDGKIFLVHFDDAINVPVDQMTDLDRVFPGDGILDLTLFIRKIREQEYNGFISVEIFNKDYWVRDPFSVAKEAKNRLDKYLKGE